jgi:hypothetical protein
MRTCRRHNIKDIATYGDCPLCLKEIAALPSKAESLLVKVEATWNACYPDRRKWADIGESAQAEWIRVFGYFAQL